MVYSAAFLNGRTHSNSFNHIPTGLYYVLGTLILRQWCKLIWFSLNQWFKDSNLKLNVIIFEKKIHVSISFALFKIQFWFDSIFDILGAPSLMLEQNPCTLFSGPPAASVVFFFNYIGWKGELGTHFIAKSWLRFVSPTLSIVVTFVADTYTQ